MELYFVNGLGHPEESHLIQCFIFDLKTITHEGHFACMTLEKKKTNCRKTSFQPNTFTANTVECKKI